MNSMAVSLNRVCYSHLAESGGSGGHEVSGSVVMGTSVLLPSPKDPRLSAPAVVRQYLNSSSCLVMWTNQVFGGVSN